MDLPDDLLGRRVSLRHRIGERDGRPLYSDAVGEVRADGDALVVDTRRGPVRVARAAVVAVRAVPPAPPRRASLTAIARLEGLCADAWPAQVDEPLGAWRLRAAGGFTARANSALAIGDPDTPFALDAVRAFAARHGIEPRVQVPVGSPWDRTVEAQGWLLDVNHAAGAEVAVLVAGLDALAPPTPIERAALSSEPSRRECHSSDVELLDHPPPSWWALATGGLPSPVQRRVIDPPGVLRTGFALVQDPDRPPRPAQRHVIDPGGTPLTAFALVQDPDGPIGTLRAAVVQDHLHLSLLEVAPHARRHGLATALVVAAAGWGRGQGARWAVLQVALHNTGARAFYERLGCTEHHRYRYLVPPPA